MWAEPQEDEHLFKSLWELALPFSTQFKDTQRWVQLATQGEVATRALMFRNPDLIIPALQHCKKEIFVANLWQLNIAAQAGWNTHLGKVRYTVSKRCTCLSMCMQQPGWPCSTFLRPSSSLSKASQALSSHLQLCRLLPDGTQVYAHPCWLPVASHLTQRCSHPLCARACVLLVIPASSAWGSQKKPRTGENAHDRYLGERREKFNSPTESHTCW